MLLLNNDTMVSALVTKLVTAEDWINFNTEKTFISIE